MLIQENIYPLATGYFGRIYVATMRVPEVVAENRGTFVQNVTDWMPLRIIHFDLMHVLHERPLTCILVEVENMAGAHAEIGNLKVVDDKFV